MSEPYSIEVVYSEVRRVTVWADSREHAREVVDEQHPNLTDYPFRQEFRLRSARRAAGVPTRLVRSETTGKLEREEIPGPDLMAKLMASLEPQDGGDA